LERKGQSIIPSLYNVILRLVLTRVLLLWTQGGRFTLTPPQHVFDAVYLSLVLLLAGSVIELDASPDVFKPEGTIVGVVASRRQRGDRIEVWIGGPTKGTGPSTEWLDRVRDSMARELEYPDIGRYKKHFGDK
jgi:hypothetical protein